MKNRNIHTAAMVLLLTAVGPSLAGPGSNYGGMPGMMGPGHMMGPGAMRYGNSDQRPPGYGPGPMGNWTPEQRRQHWEQMREQGYGPGAMRWPGYGPGMMGNTYPEQRQQHWEQMREQGYGPGAMRNMTPEQRQQHWEQMRQQGYGPGAMPAPTGN